MFVSERTFLISTVELTSPGLKDLTAKGQLVISEEEFIRKGVCLLNSWGNKECSSNVLQQKRTVFSGASSLKLVQSTRPNVRFYAIFSQLIRIF